MEGEKGNEIAVVEVEVEAISDIKPFSREGWEYRDEQSVAKFADRVMENTGESASELMDVLRKHGGKAFGLRICEIMAGFDTSGKLAVPTWKPYKPGDEWQFGEVKKKFTRDNPTKVKMKNGEYYGMCHFREFWSNLVIRSSHYDEDWIDERSGMHPSYNLNKFGVISKIKEGLNCREVSNKEMADFLVVEKNPLIVQEWAQGPGVVVDIAFSELFGKVISRVSNGYVFPEYENFRYSHPVSDEFNETEIFDAQTGQSLVSSIDTWDMCGYGLRGKTLDLDVPRREIANLLKELCGKVGIDFGVQFELVVDVENPDKWYLLQVRPLPESMRGKNTLENVDLGNYDCIATSPLVNGVFDFEGRIEIVEKSSQHKKFYATIGLAEKKGVGAVYWGHLSFLEEKRKNPGRCKGKVGLFIEDPFPQTDAAYVQLAIIGATAMGASGHIVTGPIQASFAHNYIKKGDLSVGNVGGCIGIELKEGVRLAELDPEKVRIVSDGIVGMVLVPKTAAINAAVRKTLCE